jgi:hypothetical protein
MPWTWRIANVYLKGTTNLGTKLLMSVYCHIKSIIIVEIFCHMVYRTKDLLYFNTEQFRGYERWRNLSKLNYLVREGQGSNQDAWLCEPFPKPRRRVHQRAGKCPSGEVTRRLNTEFCATQLWCQHCKPCFI